MGSANGKDYVLQFGCGDCGIVGDQYRSNITVDPENDEDTKKLQRWLVTHSADGGVYRTIFRRHNAEAVRQLIGQGWTPVGDVASRGLKLRKEGIEIDAESARSV